MRKMKKGPALAAGIVSVLNVPILLFGLFAIVLSDLNSGFSMSAGDMVALCLPTIITIVLMILLAVCCFRRKLGIFPGIVMGLHALQALYNTIGNITNLVRSTGSSTAILLFLCNNLLRVALFTLLLLFCISKKEKRSRFLPIGFVVIAVVSLIANFLGTLPAGVRLSDLNLSSLFVLVFGSLFGVLFGELLYVFLALAVNGAKENEVDPYAQQMAQFQAAQYQQPQYQQPQYQQPQYQQPQYQAPQYQAPQYQAPQASSQEQ